jgi:hypothetical protein
MLIACVYLFICLMAPVVAETTQHNMIGLVNNELQGMWREAAMA